MLQQVQGKISPVDKQSIRKLVKLGFYGSESDAIREAIRDLIKKHTKDLGISQREARRELSQGLTREEEDLLVGAAEDFWERYHHFEEEAVRKFLKTRVSTRDWPEWKLDEATEFVCSQSRKN